MTLIDLYNYFDTHKEPKFFINNCFCWRANYNDVAFTPSRIGTRETSIQIIKRALRHPMPAYKGGIYNYDNNTKVHFEFEECRYSDNALEIVLLAD